MLILNLLFGAFLCVEHTKHFQSAFFQVFPSLDRLKVQEKKLWIVNQQSVTHRFQCDLCDVGVLPYMGRRFIIHTSLWNDTKQGFTYQQYLCSVDKKRLGWDDWVTHSCLVPLLIPDNPRLKRKTYLKKTDCQQFHLIIGPCDKKENSILHLERRPSRANKG